MGGLVLEKSAKIVQSENRRSEGQVFRDKTELSYLLKLLLE